MASLSSITSMDLGNPSSVDSRLLSPQLGSMLNASQGHQIDQQTFSSMSLGCIYDPIYRSDLLDPVDSFIKVEDDFGFDSQMTSITGADSDFGDTSSFLSGNGSVGSRFGQSSNLEIGDFGLSDPVLGEYDDMSSIRNRSNTWHGSRAMLQSLKVRMESGPPDTTCNTPSQLLPPCNSIHKGFSIRMPAPTYMSGTADSSAVSASSSLGSVGILVGSPVSDASPQPDSSTRGAGKKNVGGTRRNAWGNISYADLITKAINESPEKRLTLAQIYDWMVQNIDYFGDKGDSNSSAGWKNSIRHNLSLHSRFQRVQNESTGKSSWWIINPDARPTRTTRRRQSLESNTKIVKNAARRAHMKAKKASDAARIRMTSSEGSDAGSCAAAGGISGAVASFPMQEKQQWSGFRERALSATSGKSRPDFSSLKEDPVSASDSFLKYEVTDIAEDLNSGLSDIRLSQASTMDIQRFSDVTVSRPLQIPLVNLKTQHPLMTSEENGLSQLMATDKSSLTCINNPGRSQLMSNGFNSLDQSMDIDRPSHAMSYGSSQRVMQSPVGQLSSPNLRSLLSSTVASHVSSSLTVDDIQCDQFNAGSRPLFHVISSGSNTSNATLPMLHPTLSACLISSNPEEASSEGYDNNLAANDLPGDLADIHLNDLRSFDISDFFSYSEVASGTALDFSN